MINLITALSDNSTGGFKPGQGFTKLSKDSS